jgi:hypothetical protein
MEAVVKRNTTEAVQETRTGKGWLIIAAIFFLLMFVPDPGKFIPVVGEVEELAEGGLGFSALAIFIVKYWMRKKVMQKVKKHV